MSERVHLLPVMVCDTFTCDTFTGNAATPAFMYPVYTAVGSTMLDDSELSDASAGGFGSCSPRDRRFSLILTSSVLAVPEFEVPGCLY
eukprot:COSAG02_NODE_1552_length_11961_cov_12.233182_6_plen_88_part_00